MGTLKVGAELVKKIGIKKALKDALQKAGDKDIITYDDKFIGSESGDGEVRKLVADHNVQAMGAEGQAYRDSFEGGYFHGTDADIKAFQTGSAPGWGEGVYFSDMPSDTEEFGQTIYPAYLNIKNPYRGEHLTDKVIEQTPTWKKIEQKAIEEERRYLPEGMTDDEIRDELSIYPSDEWGESGVFANKVVRDLGYDSIQTKGSNNLSGTETVVFNPANIRSKFAAFDPAKADSPNLLASAAPVAVGAGLLGQSEDVSAAINQMGAPSAMEQLTLGNPDAQDYAAPARFPALHSIANKIDNYQDPTGMLFDTSGTADWLRQFGERGNPYSKLMSAFGAAPF